MSMARTKTKGFCTCAPSSTFMKSLPWRVLVARSPSLQTKPRPAELFISSVLLRGRRSPSRRCRRRTELTSVLTGAPSPRPDGRSAASSGEALARGGEHDHRVGGLALERLQQRVAVLEAQAADRSRPWPVRARIQPFCDRITVIGSSTTVRSTCARSAVLIRVRRSSPYFFASSLSSLDDELLQLLLVAQQLLQAPCGRLPAPCARR